MGLCFSSTAVDNQMSERFDALSRRISSLETKLSEVSSENEQEKALAILRLKCSEATNEVRSLEHVIVELKQAREVTERATSTMNQSKSLQPYTSLSVAPVTAKQASVALVHSQHAQIRLEIVKLDGSSSIMFSKATTCHVGTLAAFVNRGESVRILASHISLAESGTEGYLCMLGNA